MSEASDEAIAVEQQRAGWRVALLRHGHTEHCLARLAWGDGACECGALRIDSVVAYLWEQHAPVTAVAIAEALGVSVDVVHRRLRRARRREQARDLGREGRTGRMLWVAL